MSTVQLPSTLNTYAQAALLACHKIVTSLNATDSTKQILDIAAITHRRSKRILPAKLTVLQKTENTKTKTVLENVLQQDALSENNPYLPTLMSAYHMS